MTGDTAMSSSSEARQSTYFFNSFVKQKKNTHSQFIFVVECLINYNWVRTSTTSTYKDSLLILQKSTNCNAIKMEKYHKPTKKWTLRQTLCNYCSCHLQKKNKIWFWNFLNYFLETLFYSVQLASSQRFNVNWLDGKKLICVLHTECVT